MELQSKFDELESLGVFGRPEELGIVAEYVNLSFLVAKQSGGSRLVTAFNDVGKYCKPQPSLMADVDTTLRIIAKWKFIITSDLSKAFYQIPLDHQSMKFCGVVTPFKGVRVYKRCAMGMPGSETALEELMCRVFGDLIEEGVVTKLADDLYCGGNSHEELLYNWSRVLEALEICNLRLSPSKTTICPKTTNVLGWVWADGTLTATSHRISTLATCQLPETVRAMRSFIGAYKSLSRVLPNCSQLISPLDDSIHGQKSQDRVVWSDRLKESFLLAQKGLSSHKSITLPRPTDQLWVVTDGSVKQHGIGSTLYITRQNTLKVAGFYSAKLRNHQVKWLPCEIEALGIGAAIKHFSPFIIQSRHRTCVLTDSKPCVQAIQRLERGEFSASPRVTTFLTAASRFHVDVRHLAGSANIPSDFASRNAPACEVTKCQICSFIRQTEESVIHKVTVSDILSGRARLPYASRSAWRSTQMDDSDLRRVHAYLSQGTRPSKKLTSIKDIKRYLQKVTIARDGLLVVPCRVQLTAQREAIVVPRKIAHGLVTAMHLKLDHPTKHQLKKAMNCQYHVLDLETVVDEVSDGCHICASLLQVPSSLIEQSTGDPPDAVGSSFAADVMKRNKQLVLVVRETVTSFTVCRLIDNEQADTLRSVLMCLCTELRPMDGPRAVIRVDPAPGFIALKDDELLAGQNIQLEVGRIKNPNKNPVAEKAIGELEQEILKQDPVGGPVTPLTLALAAARLNSRIRGRGLSAREMLMQRSQFTNEQLPFSDQRLIQQQHEQRTTNHPYSEKHKAAGHDAMPSPDIKVGDIVYLHADKDKNKARDRYIVVSIDGKWCFIRKFTGSQLRSSSYKVKLAECFHVPSYAFSHITPPNHIEDDSELEYVVPADIAQPQDAHEIPQPPAPPDIPSIIAHPTEDRCQAPDQRIDSVSQLDVHGMLVRITALGLVWIQVPTVPMWRRPLALHLVGPSAHVACPSTLMNLICLCDYITMSCFILL